MIYVDASVVIAELLAEDLRPPLSLWDDELASSRLIDYETWSRINNRGLGETHGDRTRQLLGRISKVELTPVALGRALEPFPLSVRTLDAIHLSSLIYVRDQRADVTFATYDRRLLKAAAAMGIALYEPDLGSSS